jgi:hypothetical protein
MIFRSHGLLQIKQGTIHFPCAGFASYPFVDLPPRNDGKQSFLGSKFMQACAVSFEADQKMIYSKKI